MKHSPKYYLTLLLRLAFPLLLGTVIVVYFCPNLVLRANLLSKGYLMARIVNVDQLPNEARDEWRRYNTFHSWVVFVDGKIVGVGRSDGSFVTLEDLQMTKLRIEGSNARSSQ